MITLIVLVGVFALVLFYHQIVRKRIDVGVAGRIAMSAMLLFTGVGHFVYTQGMTLMLPDFIPAKTEIVIFTGLLEILAAILLLIRKFQKIISVLLIIFLAVLLPANIHAAINHVNYQMADFSGRGTSYLWFRVPLQLLFIGWVWYFGYLDRGNENKRRPRPSAPGM